MYQVLYRKWRPKSFDDVYGQEHITSTLKNEIKSGRINHAYLFTGSRGTGKTTCAKILAKAVNCPNSKDGNPCNECDICKGIDNGSITDVLELDAASNRGINDIKEILANVRTSPERCKYRVYIIDEVHMLSADAFNALLKTLEEPPEHIIFILATTEIHKVLQTIQSRCQRFDFNRIATRTIADRLLFVANLENIELTDSAAMLIGSISDGGLRDALSLLDRCIALSNKIDDKIVANAAGLADKSYLYELATCVINKNTAKALGIISTLYSQSKDMSRLCSELIDHFRSLMMIKSVRNPRDIIVMSDDDFEKALTQSDYLSLADIVFYMDVLSRTFQRMGKGSGDRTEFEMAMVKLSSPEIDGTTEALTARITTLENAIKSGIQVAPSNNNVITPEKVVQTEKQDIQEVSELKENNVIPEKADKLDNSEINATIDSTGIEKQKQSNKTVTANKTKITKSRNIEEIYANAKPFVKWVEIVNNMKPFSRAIGAAFEGSTAYESGNYLLIDTQSEIAFDLLKNQSRREEIKNVILQTTGKQYSLGPYKKPVKSKKRTDTLQNFKNIIKENGIPISEE